MKDIIYMTADEIFKKLGYKKQDGYYSVEYTKKIDIYYVKGRTKEKHINFKWEDNEGIEAYSIIIDKEFLKKTQTQEEIFLEPDEIEAISKKMSELGW